MPLKPGTNDNGLTFSASMAEAMVNAFLAEWPKVMGNETPPPESLDQMKLLFAAVAQGVVTHLKQHATDFKVSVTNSGIGTNTGTVTQID